ncbi:hypothetical protein B0T20DRAFT_489300 [Sordaria brevicollis]|uniref:Dihydroorotate dehydrogenase (fumarate) n=1 Tax=Sordaria brevicollis TaxID=83679 RepID=A0AAE0P2R7_SORBR|nr:hypothetical protein B0T20DRAFT_489300 [Sordaria brevicollis]
MTVPKLNINPPLINTPCPAATTHDDLLALWLCPSTGGITTRTSLIGGFAHDDTKNLWRSYDSSSHTVSSSVNPPSTSALPTQNATLNSLGYSPLDFFDYLSSIRLIVTRHPPPNNLNKTIIISVTGSPTSVAECYTHIARLQAELFPHPSHTSGQIGGTTLAMEINLSCPNIPSHPPPAYSRESLGVYLSHLTKAITQATKGDRLPRVAVGLKTPPYTYQTQFEALIDALETSALLSTDSEEGCPISFITATNTLGSCLAFTDNESEEGEGAGALPTELGTGGLAGAPLHPLALGNVRTLRRMLDEKRQELGHEVQVIGVGGVMDSRGYRRMRKAGADVVGLASGLLLKGVEVFGEIEKGLGEDGW